MYDTATPFIASFAILRRDGKIAFVLRAHTGWMDGKYGLPSGKVEQNESFSAAAVREAKEEVGVTVKPEDLSYVLTMHRIHPNESTWVDVFFEATSWEGEPINGEPDKHDEIAWFDPTDLPENVVPPVRAAIEAIESGHIYAEYGWEE